jgi:NTE family protein
VSIGAINASIIAGNSRAKRLQRLREFWETITERKIWHYTPDGDAFRKARNAASSWVTMTIGQPGFFKPRDTNPWLSLAGAQSALSYYDSEPLRETLLNLVDFDLINEKTVGLAVGAVNVLSGNFIYFDNSREEIGPEHIMASGALPPALPMVKIGTDQYWDGGIVSNTPLQHLLDQESSQNTLSFKSIYSVRAEYCRGTFKRFWHAIKISCIHRGRATTPTSTAAFIAGRPSCGMRWTRLPMNC